MDLKIDIITNETCKVLVQDNSEYLAENIESVVKNKFKYSDTISIDVVQHNKLEEAEVKVSTYSLHTNKEDIEIPIKFDGWFTIHHIVLPSDVWVYKELSKETGSAIPLYSIVYFTDGKGVYKYINKQVVAASIEEVLEINPINTTISKTQKDYVSICFLKKCYINLCQQIFENRGFSSCWNKNNIDSELVYKRDLVWMAINVIKYLTKCEQLYEVERIIEQINGCNGLCNKSNITSKVSGCGCSK